MSEPTPHRRRVLASALALAAIAAAPFVTEGWALFALGAGLSLAALPGAPPGRLRRLTAGILAAAALGLLTVFTVRVAVPNIVVAGNLASHTVAVSTLRTVLWAEDQHLVRTGRRGTLAELAAASLLRPELAPNPDGVALHGGYAYRVFLEAAGDGGPATDGDGTPRAG